MRSLLLATIVIPLCSLVAVAQYPGQENSLTGMRGVKVVIYTGDKGGLKEIGLSADLLKTDVELRLRKAGVPVLLGKGWPEGYLKAVLVVAVLTTEHDKLYAVTIKVQLWRIVHDNPNPATLSTWESLGNGIFGEDAVRAGTRNALGDHVDGFINDYLAANPAKQHERSML